MGGIVTKSRLVTVAAVLVAIWGVSKFAPSLATKIGINPQPSTK